MALLFAVGCGADGANGKDGAKGDPGPAGADGPAGDPGKDGADGKDGVAPALTNDVTGTVTDGANPLQGVTVTAEGSAKTASTDAQGKFTLSALDVGAYELTLHKDGYVDQTIGVAVNLAGPTSVTVALAVDKTKLTPPAVSVSDNLLAGFGAAISLEATVTGTAPFTYKWTQAGGPKVDLTGDTTDTVSFTTQSFVESVGPAALENARFGTLGINPDQAGNYVFEVEVTDADGLVTKADVKVNATRPSSGLRMVPIGVPVHLQGDGKLAKSTVTGAAAAQTTWSWTLDKTGAAGSTATLSNPTSQFPSFVPDVKGVYELTESVANKTMTVYAGTWMGMMTADGSAPSLCATCHSGSIASDNFTPWKTTRHYEGPHEKLDGVSTPYFAEECMSCHTVGYDKTAANSGFDDAQAGSGWSFPAKLEEGNWQTLVQTPNLGPLAGIQCESCHGPQTGPSGGPHTSSTGASPDTGARISLSADVCAGCHQEAPHHYKPGQWAESGHANLELAIGEGAVEKRGDNAGHCGRCHSGQGFIRYAMQLGNDYYGYLTNDGKALDPTGVANHKATQAEMSKFGMTMAEVQPQTCAACHDPHDAENPAQLRVYDEISALPNGMTNISGMGTGAVCAACHNSRNAEHSDYAQNTTDANGDWVATPYLTSFSGPHSSAQGDFVYGFNTYFTARYNPSAHLAVKDTCAGCHYGVATGAQQMSGQANNHSFKVDKTICASCHADAVDGEALQAANAMALKGLRSSIARKTRSIIADAISYEPPTGTMGVYVRAYDKTTNSYSSSASTWSPTATGWISLIGNAPTAVDLAYASNGSTQMLELTVPNAVTFTPTAAGAAQVTANKILVAFSGIATNQIVINGDDAAWPKTGPGAAYYSVFSVPGPKSGSWTTTYPEMPDPPPWDGEGRAQVLYKAYWNMSLLANDNTLGIHNPKFFNEVITKTSARLGALPN